MDYLFVGCLVGDRRDRRIVTAHGAVGHDTAITAVVRLWLGEARQFVRK
jgi:hypothetical protein